MNTSVTVCPIGIITLGLSKDVPSGDYTLSV